MAIAQTWVASDNS